MYIFAIYLCLLTQIIHCSPLGWEYQISGGCSKEMTDDYDNCPQYQDEEYSKPQYDDEDFQELVEEYEFESIEKAEAQYGLRDLYDDIEIGSIDSLNY